MDLLIRPATAADEDVIVRFNTALAWESEAKKLDEPVLRAGVRAVLADPHKGFYTVAEAAGAVVGQTLITFEYSDWRHGWYWWIQSVYVRPEARRQGVYAALYHEIERQAQLAGACGVRLYVENDNQSAMATYARLGMIDAHYRVMERSFR